jgi:hypothetical protein
MHLIPNAVRAGVVVASLFILLPIIVHGDEGLTATFVGGSGVEGWQYSDAVDIAVADDGTIYIAGVTTSSDFPVSPGAYNCIACSNEDFFVVRLTGDLSTLLAATVIGGTANEVFPSIALAADGSVFVSGATLSNNFPTTPGAYDSYSRGYQDVVVARFDANLTALIASTRLGGNGTDYFTDLALDHDGNVVLSGVTSTGATNSFPTTEGAFDRVASVGYADFFVAILNPGLSDLLASTFVGGRYSENWPGVAVDPDGNIVIVGASESDDYPTTAGAYDEDYAGAPRPGQYAHDVVVSKLNGDLTTLLASTYIGGNLFDGGQGMCLDPWGDIFVAGHTECVDYPTTPDAFDIGHNGQNEYMVTKLNNDLTDIMASTYFTPGTASFTYANGISCDASGNLLMVGGGWDDLVPTTPYGYDRTCDGPSDLFIRVMSPDLTTMLYGSLLGGSGDEGDGDIVIGPEGHLYIAGYTTSGDFPVTAGSYDDSYNGGDKDAYAVRLEMYEPCCLGRVGDANDSGEDEPTIGDVTTLIDALFIAGDPSMLQCPAESDINQSGGILAYPEDITIGDVSYLIDYLFISGASIGLPNCL